MRAQIKRDGALAPSLCLMMLIGAFYSTTARHLFLASRTVNCWNPAWSSQYAGLKTSAPNGWHSACRNGAGITSDITHGGGCEAMAGGAAGCVPVREFSLPGVGKQGKVQYCPSGMRHVDSSGARTGAS